MKRRLPAEWEPQDGVLLAWPHAATDWAPVLEQVVPVFVDLAAEISRFERVVVVADDPAAAESGLRRSGAQRERVEVRSAPLNDTWARDFGPIAVEDEDGERLLLLDFAFNGWGLKFPADQDNRITRRLADGGAFAVPVRSVGLVLEGGSIEGDGRGTILTTSECLLGPNRNPHLDRAGVEAVLRAELGADRFLWLQNGHLVGDDTDAHVDTLARFAPGDTIVHVACDDPGDEHFEVLRRMEDELRGFRTRQGRPYRLIPLPWPAPVADGDGRRLPATYANFLVLNGAVLVPTYRDRRDAEALAAVARAFPGREVIGLDCRPLVLQHGSLHCVTMQLPKGVLR
ncbi:MAG: agmatine deiminase family protein [Deltaproteobacteria bacterium]|nr:agmatine deiminase family protein [Deltaproteobacteria bacterium]